MAHSISYWYDVIIAEKNSQATLNGLQPNMDNQQTLLTDLTSTSKVAKWRLWAYITAVACYTLETFWDLFFASVAAYIATFRPGTLRWYQQKVFDFQYGYQLQWIDNQWQYATIDDTAKIVKRCAATEPGGTIRIKAAKLSGTDIVPLSGGELAALNAYLQRIKYAGTFPIAVSYVADKLKVYYQVYYDPLTDLATLTAAVEAAINNYLANLPFDGKINLTHLTDAIQLVTGVVDPVLQGVYWQYGALAYAPIVREQTTNAGYAQVDPSFPLSTTITYIPYV